VVSGWRVGSISQNLRCMVIESYDDDDSVFGMNHAYGWPFMLQLAKKAGLTWWRDWSVKWHEVEAAMRPAPEGRFGMQVN
jgi:hypothetical protein